MSCNQLENERAIQLVIYNSTCMPVQTLFRGKICQDLQGIEPTIRSHIFGVFTPSQITITDPHYNIIDRVDNLWLKKKKKDSVDIYAYRLWFNVCS